MNHLNAEEIARIADGESQDDAHLRECAICASAVLGEMRLKRAVREAMPRYEVPESLRRRVSGGGQALSPGRTGAAPIVQWMGVAAAAAIVILVVLLYPRGHSANELVDMHATLLASPNAVDVLSTDKHTVKPWFEGRVPFAVPVPDLQPPFHLVGGRVVYWHQQPGAYLLIAKGAHRISLFIFRDELRAMPTRDVTSEVWRANGLTFVAIADVPQQDLDALRRSF
jgi:anti-sigma factor RsiW